MNATSDPRATGRSQAPLFAAAPREGRSTGGAASAFGTARLREPEQSLSAPSPLNQSPGRRGGTFVPGSHHRH